jgi:hypothetical protein
MPRNHASKKNVRVEKDANELVQQYDPLVDAFVFAISQSENKVPRLLEYNDPDPKAIIKNIRHNMQKCMAYKNNQEIFHYFLMGCLISEQADKYPPMVMKETLGISTSDYKIATLLFEIFKNREDDLYYLENVTIGTLRCLTLKGSNYIITQVLKKKPHPWELLPEFQEAPAEEKPIRVILERENQEKKTEADILLETCHPEWELWVDPDLDPKLSNFLDDPSMELEYPNDLEVYGDVDLENQWD